MVVTMEEETTMEEEKGLEMRHTLPVSDVIRFVTLWLNVRSSY